MCLTKYYRKRRNNIGNAFNLADLMQSIRVYPGQFGVADYESDLIFKRLSTLIVAPHAGFSFPADSFLVHKSNISPDSESAH